MEQNILVLNNKGAYLKNKPIYSKEKLLNNKKLLWDKIEKEWMASMEDSFWFTKYDKNKIFQGLNEDKADHIRKILKLRDKLLEFGGDQACMPWSEEDIDNILERGQFWYGDKLIYMKGEPCQCHMNSISLWNANKDKTFMCTGYALSKDGMWRQHSWCIKFDGKINKIVETTVRRIAYFGFIMTGKEAEDFLNEY